MLCTEGTCKRNDNAGENCKISRYFDYDVNKPFSDVRYLGGGS